MIDDFLKRLHQTLGRPVSVEINKTSKGYSYSYKVRADTEGEAMAMIENLELEIQAFIQRQKEGGE